MINFSDKKKIHNLTRICTWTDTIQFRPWTEEIFLSAFHPFHIVPKLRTNNSTCLNLTACIYIYRCKQICTCSLSVSSSKNAGDPVPVPPEIPTAASYSSDFRGGLGVITATLELTEESVSKKTCFQAYDGIYLGGLLLIF